MHTPDIFTRRVLDVGSGRGDFLVELARRGGKGVGVEIYDVYREEAGCRAQKAGVSVDIKKGVAESLPFPEESFGFINMSELIEHVEDPDRVLKEAHRVLEKDGRIYISVPNRFGFFDPHFHLYGVNWLPRVCAPHFISLFGSHKIYTKDAGRQKLTEMHYYTYRAFFRMAHAHGFSVKDIRAERIHKILPRGLRACATGVYAYIFRPWYFNTFHLMLEK